MIHMRLCLHDSVWPVLNQSFARNRLGRLCRYLRYLPLIFTIVGFDAILAVAFLTVSTTINHGSRIQASLRDFETFQVFPIRAAATNSCLLNGC